MTLNEYVKNPMGKNNSVTSSATREVQKNRYLIKFNQLMVRESGNIRYYCYYDEKNNVYWFHCKTPSEHVKNFYYDVIFKFFADAKTGTSNNLFDWSVQFYSNDPAFVFTYVYAFNRQNLFTKELRGKMSKQALSTSSKEKNPTELVGYCKIIYFAYLVMKNKNLNKINLFKANLSLFNPKEIYKNIEHADRKVEDRQAQKVSHAKKKTVSEEEYKRMKRIVGADIKGANVRTTKKVGTITNTAAITKTKKIGKISRKK